ncbi:MAG: hypothetical protein ACOC44_09525 [Promethearchaeia archaeon]
MLTKEKPNAIEMNYEEILVVCPVCQEKKQLKIPARIVSESKQLTTVSIPQGLHCDHTFQLFVDKNFKVRGYQKVDFELSKIEFYEESTEGSEDDEVSKFVSLPIFKEIIGLLRDYVDNVQVLGSAIFTVKGKVLYSSLPDNELFDTIKEFKVRNEENLINIKKMFLELENKRKVFSKYMTIKEMKFILILLFAPQVKLGLGNLFVRELVKKIQKLNK